MREKPSNNLINFLNFLFFDTKNIKAFIFIFSKRKTAPKLLNIQKPSLWTSLPEFTSKSHSNQSYNYNSPDYGQTAPTNSQNQVINQSGPLQAVIKNTSVTLSEAHFLNLFRTWIQIWKIHQKLFIFTVWKESSFSLGFS